MIPTNYQELIRSLATKTNNGQIFWNRVSDTQFKLVLNRSIITIDWWQNQNEKLTSIDIYNLNGDIIDRYIASNTINPNEYQYMYGFYIQIYNVINRKLEETINNILVEINQGGIIGKKDNAK